MNKCAVYMLSTLLFTVFIFVTAYSQDDMMFVDNSVFSKPERTAAVFEHDAHNEMAAIEVCDECHHIYEEGIRIEDESSEDQMCSECHDIEATGRVPGLMKAFHLNCKGCHLDRKKGPIMCGECHLR